MYDKHAFEFFYQDRIYIYQDHLWQNSNKYLLYLFQTDIFYIYVYAVHHGIKQSFLIYPKKRNQEENANETNAYFFYFDRLFTFTTLWG